MKHQLTVKRILIFSLFCLFLGLSSCNLLKGLDNLDLSKIIRKANPAVDSLGKGVGDSLMSGVAKGEGRVFATARKNIGTLVDSLNPDVKKLVKAINTISDTTTVKIKLVGGTLNWEIGRLKGDVKDIKDIVLSLTAELKKQTEGFGGKLLLNALDSVNSKKGRRKIDSVMSALLDSNTNTKAQKLISGALQPALDSIKSVSHQLTHVDIPFMTKQAVILVSVIGAIILAIMAFAWYERNRYAKTLKILTYQIDKIPAAHQAVYDDLTSRIKDHAQREGMEPFLGNVLKSQGINP